MSILGIVSSTPILEVVDRSTEVTTKRIGELGYGKALVFLGPRGEVLRSYELKDVLTQDQMQRH